MEEKTENLSSKPISEMTMDEMYDEMKKKGFKERRSAVPSKWFVGPHGLGEPDDLSLRHAEIDILIPKRMKEKAKTEKCNTEIDAFHDCFKNHKVTFPYKCRRSVREISRCMRSWLNNPEFQQQVTDEYLADRSLFRATGVGELKRERINRYTKNGNKISPDMY